MKRIITMIVAIAMFSISTRGQGFVNLNFESAQNLTNNPGFYGALMAVTNALPGWTAYDGPITLSDVYYVTNSARNGSPVQLQGDSRALSGNFSVGFGEKGSISQAGLVPGDAESLLFEAYIPGASGFSVALGGQTLSYSAISNALSSSGFSYTVYGANIPADMAGQMETLTFLVQEVTPGVLLDNIEFSPMSVPEPSEFALIGLGAILFGLYRMKIPGRTVIPKKHSHQKLAMKGPKGL